MKPPRPSLLLPLVAAVLLSACASVAPPASAPLSAGLVPASWQGATATNQANPASLVDWWQRFGDPTLTELVTQALLANPNVQSARSALQQARASVDVQRAGLVPRVGTSASVQRSRSGSNDPSNRFQAGFDASWEPDIFGGNRASVNASEADASATAASLGNVQVSLAAEVALNYIDLRSLQARLAIARSNLATQTETLQITRWRAQAGLVSSLDVELAISASEQTQAQIPLLQTSLAQRLNALAVLTGRAPGSLDAALNNAAPLPAAPAELALAFPADTLRQRPDVRAAELRSVAALARVGVAEAARKPSFQLSGSLGLSALTLGALTNGASLLNSLVAGFSAPLFDGGAGKAQVRAQEAAWDQARLAYQGAVLTALQDVEDALVALRGDQERLLRLQAASTAAANAELLARQRYNSGLIDFTTVLTTQRSLLSAQDSAATAQASLIADYVRLYKALGGGWQPDVESNAGGTIAAGSTQPRSP